MRFEIKLFGAIEISSDGKPVTGFRSQQTLVLLAYLITEDRLHTRDYLAGLFWPDVSQSKALGRLRRDLHNLTRLLPDCLEVDRRAVRFRPNAPVAVDLRAFTELARQGDIESLAQAAALARAPFLEGVYLKECPELETWIVSQQERWRQEVVGVAQRLVEAYSRQGADEQALTYARQLVRLDPWRENFHRQVMRLLVRCDRREAALTQFETCQRILDEELGLAVSPKTIELYERMQDAPIPPHNLPAETTPFIGREKELAQLQTLLAEPAHRLLTIAGPGGVGKTRLALALARRVVNRFLEGVWYVELAGAETADLLPGRMASALGLTFAEQTDAHSRLLEYLSGKELLLALDNFERLADAGDFLSEVLQAAPAVRLLVTSRRQLNLQEELLFELEGLSYPSGRAAGQLSPSALRAYDAVALLETAARRYRQSFDVAAQPDTVAALCRLVQGLPLALELAAAAARTMPLDRVVEAIDRNVNALHATWRNVPARHRSIRAVFDYSWEQLNEQTQPALARLAVFRGGFTLEAAQAAARVSPERLGQLVAHCLVQRVGADRYEMHELLRRYAWERLDPDEAAAVRVAHAGYYLALVAKQGELFEGDEGKKALALITAEIGNARLAWRVAVARDRWELLREGVDALARYYIYQGRAPEFLPLLDLALEQLATTQTAAADLPGRLLAAKAYVLAHAGQYDESRQAAAEALRLVQTEAADRPAEIEANYALAFAQVEQGERVQARSLIQQTLTLARQSGAGRLEALLLSLLARTHLTAGETEAALAYYEQVLALAQRMPNRRLEMIVQMNMGIVAAQFADYETSEKRLQRALALAQRHGFHDRLGAIHLNLGSVAFYRGDYAAVGRHYQAAVAAYRRASDRARMGLGYYSLAVLAIEEKGDFLAAGDYLQRALSVFQKAGVRLREAMTLNQLGFTLTALGNFAEAGQRLATALKIAGEIGAQEEELVSRTRLARLAVEMGDWSTAEKELEQADALLQKIQPPDLECTTHYIRSRFWHEQGDLEQARGAAEEALQTARRRNERSIPDCAVRLGHTVADMAAWSMAQELYKEADSLWRERAQAHLAVEAQAGLAGVALARDNLDAARAHVGHVLHYLDKAEPPNTLHGAQEPARIYLTCYRALQACGERGPAQKLLQEAHTWLQVRAARLAASQRRFFLEEIPVNREIMALQPAAAGG